MNTQQEQKIASTKYIIKLRNNEKILILHARVN